MLLFYHIGRYILLIKTIFTRPENPKLLIKRTFYEMNSIGIESLGIVTMISVFMGMVMTIQSAYQLVSPLLPDSVFGAVVSNSALLEFSSTVTALILAGRVGSNISSELGNMKISEQVDALEVMGINSANYLILPKIIGGLIVFPLLVILSAFLCILGGAVIGNLLDIVSYTDFVYGAQSSFETFSLVFALIKSITFSFIITSVSAYNGYFVKGGALEVGKASTRAVVHSSILILLFDYLLSQLLL
jgi:phospholipid/cholesterol/gamma-HCH transport system permease protein